MWAAAAMTKQNNERPISRSRVRIRVRLLFYISTSGQMDTKVYVTFSYYATYDLTLEEKIVNVCTERLGF